MDSRDSTVLRFFLRALHSAHDRRNDAERHADQLHGTNEVPFHIVKRRHCSETLRVAPGRRDRIFVSRSEEWRWSIL
ncbi:hypothetical protein CBM2595_A80095 [Cupriavidus taiwanensis]|nr:hypothetical protein CBM2595_A80095 [Cupriavidus taiwanensis]